MDGRSRFGAETSWWGDWWGQHEGEKRKKKKSYIFIVELTKMLVSRLHSLNNCCCGLSFLVFHTLPRTKVAPSALTQRLSILSADTYGSTYLHISGQSVHGVATHDNTFTERETPRNPPKIGSALTCAPCPIASSASSAQCSCQHTRTTCSADGWKESGAARGKGQGAGGQGAGRRGGAHRAPLKRGEKHRRH